MNPTMHRPIPPRWFPMKTRRRASRSTRVAASSRVARLPAAQAQLSVSVPCHGREPRALLAVDAPARALQAHQYRPLIGDILPDTQVFTWYRTEPDPDCWRCSMTRASRRSSSPDDQADYAERVVGPDAVEEALSASRIPVFLLLDGTWRQARRIFRRSPYLDRLPVLPLKTRRLSRYRLRKAASSEHLCTPRSPSSYFASAVTSMPRAPRRLLRSLQRKLRLQPSPPSDRSPDRRCGACSRDANRCH